jgi:cell division topological specificity factor
MTVFDLFRRRTSAPVARERLQVLLAYERKNRNQPDLVGVLRDEIMAVLARHVQIDPENVQVTMDRGDTMSTLEIDVQIPNVGTMQMAASF